METEMPTEDSSLPGFTWFHLMTALKIILELDKLTRGCSNDEILHILKIVGDFVENPDLLTPRT
jgi:hypothetical protein